EAAGQQHAKVEKVNGILSGADEIYHRLDRLDAVVIQPSLEPKSVALFRFAKGELIGPEHLVVESEEANQLRAALDKLASAGVQSGRPVCGELAILERWEYRRRQEGENIFVKEDSPISMRKTTKV